MILFEKDLQIYQLLIPCICAGILFTSLMLFSYIYRKTRDKLYLAMLITNLLAFVFVFGEMMVLLMGGWLKRSTLAIHFHRTEQLAGAFFIFAIPYFLHHVLEINEKWKSINKLVWKAGLAVSIIILILTPILPDSFISLTKHHDSWLYLSWEHGRGKEGFLYFARDILLGLVLVYCLVVLIIDLKMHKKFKYLVFLIIGLMVAVFGAFEDILYVHKMFYIDPLSDVYFSRFSLGITFFVLLSIYGVIRQYTDKAMDVESAYHNLENAYKLLNHTEERFRQVAENIREIFIIFDYRNNAFLYISPAYEKIFNSDPNVLYNNPQDFFKYVHPDDRLRLNNALKLENLGESFDIDYRIIRPDGTLRWLRNQTTCIKDKNSEVYRLASVIEDITDRKKGEEELTYIAFHDILTGLPNRRAFFERFYELISQAKREKPRKNKALLFLDVDRFKNINDTYGHHFGDILLKEVTVRIQQCLRKSDYCYRLGSDEFTIILNGISDDIDAAVVARKLINKLSLPIPVDGREVYLGLSIGISIYPKDGEDADSLVKYADIALYEAKHAGNTYRFFDHDMNREAQERLIIENNIRIAIEKNQFSLHFQPLVRIDGTIAGMETLIRWKHPEIGYIPPARFIPVAESAGLINEIGDWTLDHACAQLKEWQDKGYDDLRISVNLSPYQFRDKNINTKIKDLLEKYDLDPACLELEITESSVMENPDETVRIMSILNEMGITFSIDDFGIGYSSLSYLKRFKIKNLKIDKSFIKDLIVDVNNTEITKAIVAMAHNLNLQVIAEGVETLEQMEFLKTLHCDLLQGYLFSRPVPADEFIILLERRNLLNLLS